ncbi:MAG: hypothetical protein WC454_10015 [Phycisphaerae bacterium]|jgi:hypothetical protein
MAGAGGCALAAHERDLPEAEERRLPSSCWIVTDKKGCPVGTSDALGLEEGGLLAVYTSVGLANTVSSSLTEAFSGVNEFPPKLCDMGFRVQFYTKADLLNKFPLFKRAALDWRPGEGKFNEKNERAVSME